VGRKLRYFLFVQDDYVIVYYILYLDNFLVMVVILFFCHHVFCLARNERKLLSRENNGDKQAMMSKGWNESRKKVRYFRCKKLGQFKRDCHVAEGTYLKVIRLRCL